MLGERMDVELDKNDYDSGIFSRLTEGDKSSRGQTTEDNGSCNSGESARVCEEDYRRFSLRMKRKPDYFGESAVEQTEAGENEKSIINLRSYKIVKM